MAESTPDRAAVARHLALLLLALALPVVCFVLGGILIEPSPGMDGYLPAFFSGLVGALLGALVGAKAIAGIWRARKAGAMRPKS